MDGREDLTHGTTAQIGLYAHRCQDVRTFGYATGGLNCCYPLLLRGFLTLVWLW